jgi:hypothetical protein
MKAPALRDCRPIFFLVIAAAMVIPTPEAEANSVTRDNLIFPLDARSAGMGQTGNADPDNIANVAFNPAIASMMDGLHFVWGRSRVAFQLAELELDGFIAGGGHHLRLNESMMIGGGLAVGYTEERWGFRSFDDPIPDWGAYVREYNVAAGVSGVYNDIIRVGIGLNVKKWKWDNEAEDEFYRQISEATVWDAGIVTTATLLNRSGYALSAAAGFAYSNFGGDIEIIDNPDYLPEAGGSEAPEYRRYGMNLQFDSPSWDRTDIAFETTLPIVSGAVNYDIVDKAFRGLYETTRHEVGGELGVLDILFFRLGRLSWKARDSSGSGSNQKTIVDTTVGFGIAIPFRNYLFRFDHAQRHFDVSDVYQKLYSVVLEVSF